MKEVYLCPVTVSQPLGDYYKLTLRSPELCTLAQKGQFLHVLCGEKTLRRPISIHDVTGDEITMIYEVKGQGTQWLSQRKPGDIVDVLGPLGHGFPQISGRILVVGGGIGVPPMYYAAKCADQAHAVLGFRSKEKALLLDKFQEICPQVKLMSDDGSLGEKGFVAQGVAQMLEQHDYAAVFACGPKIMLKTTFDACQKKGVPCYVSMEERMGCGIGACLVCAVKLRRNGEEFMGHVCKDGPVFMGEEVVWDA